MDTNIEVVRCCACDGLQSGKLNDTLLYLQKEYGFHLSMRLHVFLERNNPSSTCRVSIPGEDSKVRRPQNRIKYQGKVQECAKKKIKVLLR